MQNPKYYDGECKNHPSKIQSYGVNFVDIFEKYKRLYDENIEDQINQFLPDK